MSPRRFRHSRYALVLTLLLACAGLAGCGGGSSESAARDPDTQSTRPDAAAPGEPVVAISNATFKPSTISVAAGETVTWKFTDRSLSHNVVSDGFASPLQRGGVYAHTFDTPGTYNYRCTLHPTMKGTVEVTP